MGFTLIAYANADCTDVTADMFKVDKNKSVSHRWELDFLSVSFLMQIL